ncbi:cytochrome C oxidase subunit II [Pseudomonas aeruginosa]|uniref:Cytochrome C oxidase subunit II n=2 Tax=Pseudomonas aeruginosa group TaxID=136841 RepID=A0ABD7K980_PSEAI|nr:putative cytochrome c oxidase, subunit II [Pseudomonas paraeruginosa]KAB0750091.1 cytochrome C oxidase subunit II [Pseudomonas aeruginosa]AVR65557.1 cytochrome C oxidase subunit II [Pseudomonas paraeruginosa]AWE94849.1 putative cytochrome c oxidase, subunit II [Pseudomonas paraeruginosa]MCO3056620.1 cytochrome c oxidase subunit II [Pseudomonas aeruginosa]
MSQHSGSPYRCFYPAGRRQRPRGGPPRQRTLTVSPRHTARQAGFIRFSIRVGV